jgi:hypothetical protein
LKNKKIYHSQQESGSTSPAFAAVTMAAVLDVFVGAYGAKQRTASGPSRRSVWGGSAALARMWPCLCAQQRLARLLRACCGCSHRWLLSLGSS